MAKKQITATVMVNMLTQLAEDRDGWNVRTGYSGRGMFGERCVGVDVKPGDVLALGALIAELAVNDLAVDTDDARDIVAEVRQLMAQAHDDSMGRDVVVYWPALSVGDAGPDEDGDFEEASGR